MTHTCVSAAVNCSARHGMSGKDDSQRSTSSAARVPGAAGPFNVGAPPAPSLQPKSVAASGSAGMTCRRPAARRVLRSMRVCARPLASVALRARSPRPSSLCSPVPRPAPAHAFALLSPPLAATHSFCLPCARGVVVNSPPSCHATDVTLNYEASEDCATWNPVASILTDFETEQWTMRVQAPTPQFFIRIRVGQPTSSPH